MNKVCISYKYNTRTITVLYHGTKVYGAIYTSKQSSTSTVREATKCLQKDQRPSSPYSTQSLLGQVSATILLDGRCPIVQVDHSGTIRLPLY